MTLGHAKVAYTPRELDWRGLRFGRLGISIDTEWKTSLFLPLSLTLSLLNLYYIKCHGGRYYSGITRNKVGSRKERNKIKSRMRSANMTADHYLVLRRAIDSRKQGRRFKAVSANETQRVRTDCFVRLQSVSDKGYGGLTTVPIFSRAL